jgi:hypothetical protein
VDREVAQRRDERGGVGDEAREDVAFREDAEAADGGRDVRGLDEESEDGDRLGDWPPVESHPEAIEQPIDSPDQRPDVGVRGVVLGDGLGRAKKDDREIELRRRRQRRTEKRAQVVDEELGVALVEPIRPDVRAHRNEELVDRLLPEIRIMARLGVNRARGAHATSWRKIGCANSSARGGPDLVGQPHRVETHRRSASKRSLDRKS